MSQAHKERRFSQHCGHGKTACSNKVSGKISYVKRLESTTEELGVIEQKSPPAKYLQPCHDRIVPVCKQMLETAGFNERERFMQITLSKLTLKTEKRVQENVVNV